MILASDQSLYTGVTTDIERRFAEHQSSVRGAKYFRARTPLRVVYQEEGHTRSSACKREAEIKKFSRREKQKLMQKGVACVLE